MIKREEKAITLIALVITIVVLIILAAVAINLTLGDNGIFKKATSAKQNYQAAEAREFVEMKIAQLQIEKNGQATLQDVVDYLSDDEEITYFVSIDKVASIAGQTEIGDANEVYVVYKSYQLKIKKNLNVEYVSKVDVNLESEVVIKSKTTGYTGQKTAGETNPYYANVEIEVSGDAQISTVEIQAINGTSTTLTLDSNNKTTTEVEIGKEYKVTVVTANNRTYTKKILENTEEILTTPEAFAEFRDKVNSGFTYAGKTIELGKDINLETICSSTIGTWVPIGTDTNLFKGTLDGKNHTISNIYINATTNYQGLFGYNYGIIENVKINGSITSTISYVGGITGYNNGSIINCHNSTYIKGYTILGGIAGANNQIIEKCSNNGEIYGTRGGTGGIQGQGGGTIKECLNLGYIHGDVMSAGGISGYQNSGKIFNCYNTGKVVSGQFIGGIAGAAGLSGNSTVYIYNCYNIGSISSGTNSGSIVGLSNANGGTSNNTNCYTTNATVTLLNSGSYSDNVWKTDTNTINNGYPILNWQS